MGTQRKSSQGKQLKERQLIEGDPYLDKSREHLRFLLYNQLKSVFVNSLNAVENKLGKNFPAYHQLRAEILGIGNDEIRKMHEVLDCFNIEAVSNTSEFSHKEKGKENTDGKVGNV